ncbi:MAG TPA: uroporphyrinogen-III synthase [Caulobacteraceae bacterium]|jgi:uroporphyrinogen-III synthase|nr:uroporphyrinogen-III synthase [Caulobacteraceae bacterium]
MNCRVWVTRTRPEAEATAARLTAMGHEPVVAPVLEARPVAGVTIDLAGIDALAFSSGHAVAAFAALSPVRGLTVFTVGAGTAARAQAAGFTDVRSADGNARVLAGLVAAAHRRPSCVLHPAAGESAADLVALLAERGVTGRAVVVYETVAADLPAPPDPVDAILIHSARGAERVAALIADRPHGHIDVFAISEAAAEPLRALGFARVMAAPFPNEAALLDLLETTRRGP